MPSHPDDTYDPKSSDVPGWCSKFVRDEVRPLLLRARPTALAALERWLVMHAEQLQSRGEWESRRNQFMSQSPMLPADSRHNAEPPGEVFTSCDGPPVDSPLPPPIDRDLSVDECWAALLAVHDESRDTRELLGPVDCIAFDVLRSRVTKLSEAILIDLQEMVRRVSASQFEGSASEEIAEPDPQYVTLDQIAAIVSRSKKTLERALNAKGSTMPKPDVEGGSGKPHEWRWSHIRPWLTKEYGRELPLRFPPRL